MIHAFSKIWIAVILTVLVVGGGMLVYRNSSFQSLKTYCKINSDCADDNVCTVDSCIKGTCSNSNFVEGTSCGATLPGEGQTQFCNGVGKCVYYGPVQAGPSKTDETANWQTYRNEEFGFEVRYPKDRKGISRGSSFYIFSDEHLVAQQQCKEAVKKVKQSGIATEVGSCIFGIFISVQSLENVVKEYAIEDTYPLNGAGNALKLNQDYDAPDLVVAIPLHSDPKMLILFEAHSIYGKEGVKVDEKKTLEQILSTFRFVE